MSESASNNCFAYREIPGLAGHGECFVLIRLHEYCGTVKCPFYKPDKRYVRHKKGETVYFTHRGRIVQEYESEDY